MCEDDIGRSGTTRRFPELIGQEAIVVAGQHDPGEFGAMCHLGQRLAQDGGRRGFGIEGVASQQDCRGAMGLRLGCELADGAVTRFAQPPAQIFGQIAEALAQMQVRTVDETKHGFTQTLDRRQMQPRPRDGFVETQARRRRQPLDAE